VVDISSRRISIGVKFALPLALLGVMLSVAIGVASHGRTLAQLHEAQHRDAANVVEVMETAFADSALSLATIERWAEVAARVQGVREVIVVAGSPPRVLATTDPALRGKLLSALPREEIGQDIVRAMRTNQASFAPHSVRGSLDFTTPINVSLDDGADTRGAVMLHIDDHDERGAALRSGMIQTLLASGALGLVIVSAMGLVWWLVIVPARRIESAIARRERGDFEAVVPTLANDEIGRLADRLNGLLSALTSSQTTIDQLASQFGGATMRCVMNRDWQIEEAGAGLARLTGRTSRELIGPSARALDTLAHADDRDRVRGARIEAIRSGRGYVIEYRLLHADGSSRRVRELGRVHALRSTRTFRLEACLIELGSVTGGAPERSAPALGMPTDRSLLTMSRRAG
jgi:PAS domain-containing protein